MKKEIKNSQKKILVECWTRCVGYFRPVQQYNLGKKTEFNDRKFLKLPEEIKYKEY